MPLLWLKVAVAFYALGLFYAMAAVSRPCTFLAKIVLPGLGLGMVFHFVSLAELGMMTGHPSLALLSVHGSESLLAFLILAFFMLIYWFVTQVFSGVGSIGYTQMNQGGTAFFAHIGGFIAGLALIHAMGAREPYSRRRDLRW